MVLEYINHICGSSAVTSFVGLRTFRFLFSLQR